MYERVHRDIVHEPALVFCVSCVGVDAMSRQSLVDAVFVYCCTACAGPQCSIVVRAAFLATIGRFLVMLRSKESWLRHAEL